MSKEEEYRIEQFTLEPTKFHEIAKLISEVFQDDSKSEGGSIELTKEAFELMFGAPSIPKDMVIRAVHIPTGDIVGFTGGIPRDIAYNGTTYKFGVGSFQAVHWKHQRKGLASRMNLKLIELAKQLGYQGGFGVYEPEAHGIDAAVKVMKEQNYRIIEALRLNKFIIRVFDIKRVQKVIKMKLMERIGLGLLQGVKKPSNPNIRVFDPTDPQLKPEERTRILEDIFVLMNDHISQNQMSVVREKEEFLWYLQHPLVHCVIHESNKADQKHVDGFVLAWEMRLAGFGNSEPFGWMDTVHIYNLNAADSKDLMQHLAYSAKARGWAGLQTPYIPYFPSDPLKKAKFIFYPKRLWLNLYCFEDLPFPEKIEKFYFDWR